MGHVTKWKSVFGEVSRRPDGVDAVFPFMNESGRKDQLRYEKGSASMPAATRFSGGAKGLESLACKNSVQTVATNMFRMGKTSSPSQSISGGDGLDSSTPNPFSESGSKNRSVSSGVKVVRNDLSEDDLEVVTVGEKFFFGGLLSWAGGKGKSNPFSRGHGFEKQSNL